MSTKQTQHDNIQQHLQTGKTITSLEALSQYGSFRLAAHIFVLRKEGMAINMEMVKNPNGNSYAKYKLEVPKV